MYIGSGIIFCIICTVFRVKCQLFSREAKFMCFRMCFPQHWAVICAGHVRVKVVTQRSSHLTCAALGCQKGWGKNTISNNDHPRTHIFITFWSQVEGSGQEMKSLIWLRVWCWAVLGPPSLPRTGDSAVKIPRKAVMSLVPHGLVTNLKPDLRFSQVMIESGAWPAWHPTHQIKLFVSRTLVILTRNSSSERMCCVS